MEHENQTLYQAAKKACLEAPKLDAIYYQGKRISYKKFLRLVDRTADILYNVLGVRKDDVILLSQPNMPEVLMLFYACNKIGAIANMVHPFTPFNQVSSIIDKTNTKYAFLFEQRVAKEVEKYRDLSEKIYVTRVENFLPFPTKAIYHCFLNNKIRKKLGKARKFDGFKYFHDLKPTGKDVPVCEDYEKLSVLLHSGSTTGAPKTICLNDIPFNYVASQAESILNLPREEVTGKKMLTVLPSFHGFGLEMSMHLPIINRMGVVLVPKFSTKECNKTLTKTKYKVIIGVPTMYNKLFKDEKFINNKNLKDLVACFCGGDSIAAPLRKRINDIFIERGSKARFFEGYGLTEALAANLINTFEHNKDGSIGYPLIDMETKIVDENGNELAPNEIGEICLKSRSNMMHYFKDEEASKSALKDGWLHTGDMGYKDEDGFIFFKSRAKRVVKVSGVGVFPLEIEQLIEALPEVEKCCAIEIPDAKLQSAIKVFVVAKYFDESEMKSKIMDTCRKYLVRWAVPKEIEFRKDLPLTPLNKVDFKVLQNEENKKYNK